MDCLSGGNRRERTVGPVGFTGPCCEGSPLGLTGRRLQRWEGLFTGLVAGGGWVDPSGARHTVGVEARLEGTLD